MSLWEVHWPEFETQLIEEGQINHVHREIFIGYVKEKLKIGHALFADRGFRRSSIDLLSEMKSELVDVCGWALLLYASTMDFQVKAHAVHASCLAMQQWKTLCDLELYMNSDPMNFLQSLD